MQPNRKENIVLRLKVIVDPATANTLNGQSRICNWVYNNLLSQALDLKQNFHKTQSPDTARTLYTKRGLRNLLPKMKEENPFLKVVHSSPLKNAALRLSQAIQAHQKSKKGKRKLVGFPKFRAWKQKWFSLFYDEPNKGFKIENKNLILSLGMGQERKQRSVTLFLPNADLLKDKNLRNLRITSEFGELTATFTIQKELPAKKPIIKTIALDPNHKNLVYGVDTNAKALEIAAPTWLKIFDKRIDELKGKRDKCLKKSKRLSVVEGKEYYLPSKKWAKFHHTLKKAERKRREQTKTFMYTTAHSLCKEYDCIAIGDYAPDGKGINTKMRRAMNNRSLIGRFKKVLSWVAKKSGKTFLEYDEKGTTRTCSCCQKVVEGGIHPSIRKWQCAECKTIHHRDENSAINGLRKVLRDFSKNSETIVSQVPSLGLGSIKERWAWCVLPSGMLCMPRGQVSENLAASRN